MYKPKDLSKIYSLPKKVIFCKKCVISNQRPRIVFDKNGVCTACNYFEYKKKINWKERENELLNLLDKFRSKDSSYDCMWCLLLEKIVYVARELKTKYGMNPISVTWSPLKYTDIGLKNLNAFNDSGFDIIMGMPRDI